MQDIQYIGESVLPGRIGHFLIITAFTSALLAAWSFFKANKLTGHESDSWKKLGRSAFTVHGLSIFSIIGLIFYLMANEHYEYQYGMARVLAATSKVQVAVLAPVVVQGEAAEALLL